jgi:PhzF family phenazine biosynthesis protein
VLTAKKKGKWIVLDFPATPPEPCEAPPYLLDAFKASGAPAFKSIFDYMVVIEKPAKLRELKPDFRLLKAIEGVRGVIVTSPSDEAGVDFLSRFFAPAVGVPEDPVTGSAHCALAPYWARRLGRDTLVGRQVSSRGGIVQVELAGERVRLGGKAVTVVKGTIEV